jgi:tRNA A-37 threonylcarbamoyl transferase component Bud32
MPAPNTADELLDLVQKSALVDEPKLRTYVQKQRDANGFPADANRLAQFLVRDGLLTYFQAEQLLQGKYKRFSLGKYKVLEKLGSGGMGTVFLCEHKLMRRRVAVKVLPFQKAEDKASLDRFMREARAAAAVDHPNIVRAYDIDQDENLHFLVMEWVDGTNLQDLVKKFGPLDPLRACHYIYGAAVGLQHAYEIGLLHRDIKPGNILIDRSGVVKILDLGLARLTQDTDDNLTRQNDESVLGTADYLAPEQALDSHTVDTRADIYSLGATFYFLLTGSPPFPEGSVAQKLIWHQNRPPRALKSLRQEVPDGIVAVVEKMMAKKPEERYQTPSDVMTALSGWVSTPIPPPAERELPTLSPAVAGERALRPGAAPSMVLGRGMPSGPTGPMTGGTAAAVPLAAAPDEPAVWSTLNGDTPTGRGDTGRSETTRAETGRSSRARRGAPAATPAAEPGTGGRRKTLLLAAVAALFLTASGVGAYFAFFTGGRKPTIDPGAADPHPAGGQRIVVSKTPSEHSVTSLRAALEKAAAGDTIVIAEPRLTEGTLTVRAKHKGLTITSEVPGGAVAVVEFGGIKGGAMLTTDAQGVDGLKVRNVEFDGKGVADVGVLVNGTTPGVTFENVTVRGAKIGFKLWNAAGGGGNPLVVERCRVVVPNGGDCGVLSLATGNLDNKFIAVRNSRFEGPGGGTVGVAVEGAALDLEVAGNRFHNLGAAVRFKAAGRLSRGTIANNTAFQADAGVVFDVQPKDTPPFEFAVRLNYFVRTNQLLRVPGPVPKLTSEHNLFAGDTNPGGLAAEKRDQPALPNPHPDDDATFLRFPGGKRPTAGPKNEPVGAP